MTQSHPTTANAAATVAGVSVETLAAFGAAWNRHDIDALMSHMADDCVFHAVAGPDLQGRSFVGRDAVRAGFQLAWQTFPDAAWLDADFFVVGERGVMESTFSGTKADGTRIEARMVDIFTFKAGKIAIKNAFRKDRPPVSARPYAMNRGNLSMHAPYDARYDPLVAKNPGRAQSYAPTYWVATAGEPPPDDGSVSGDLDADVVIVGAGFTGLATALFLAREHGIKATVLEANQTAWGCTSRNGGQGQNASGRLYRSQWIARWGRDVALRLDAEIRSGYETFKQLVAEVPCDPQPGGHLYFAHRENKMDFLRREGQVMREVFGYDARILSRDEIRERYVDDAEAHGALLEPDGIGVHPLKLAFGYQRLARALGVKIHTGSPVLSCETRGGAHRLQTPHGMVRARAVGFATGGYTSNGLHRSLDSKIMPILSNSMVTRVLTPAELEATRFQSTVFITDTRTLRYYYRKLPDNRIQIGSRSAISGADAPNPKHMAVLVNGLHRKFPALKGIEIEHAWWGWVDVSHDMMPRVTQPDPKEALFYALGYGGNGVSFSAHAGRRLAQRIAGKTDPAFDLPIYNSPLEFPNVMNAVRSRAFAPFRRIGQRALYRWYHLRDERL